MPPDKGKSVFIGNIPFNMTEEEIKHLLGTVGTVTKFRLMLNPDTGKPKGFGFADYTDADSAASAVRNLNDHEIQGRKIRVDWPHNNDKDSVPNDYSQMPNLPDSNPAATSLPPLPPGVDLPPNLKCVDAISNTLKTLPPPQLLDILSQMKGLAMSNPDMAKQLMSDAPQLAYAIFQALVLMNLVDPNVLATVVEQNAHQAQPVPQQQQQLQQQQQQQQQQQHHMAQQQQQHMPQNPQTYPFQPPQNRQIPTPQQYPPQPQYNFPPDMSIQQRQMLEQVMALPQVQVDSLPPAERLQIMQLRNQYGGFVR